MKLPIMIPTQTLERHQIVSIPSKLSIRFRKSISQGLWTTMCNVPIKQQYTFTVHYIINFRIILQKWRVSQSQLVLTQVTQLCHRTNMTNWLKKHKTMQLYWHTTSFVTFLHSGMISWGLCHPSFFCQGGSLSRVHPHGHSHFLSEISIHTGVTGCGETTGSAKHWHSSHNSSREGNGGQFLW